MSDVSGTSQVLPEKTVGASYGDAFLTGLATRMIPSLDALVGQWVRMKRIVEPNPDSSAVYDAHHPIFRNLYRTTRDDIHRLGGIRILSGCG